MMQLARRATLMVVLLASVSTASAECAWVLWGRPSGGKVYMQSPDDKKPVAATGWWAEMAPPQPWIERAFPTYEACDAVLRSEFTAKADLEIVKSFPATGFGERRQMLIPALFVCLPDTIDPRGPKGK